MLWALARTLFSIEDSKLKFKTMCLAGVFSTVTMISGLQANPDVPALNPAQHPATPKYESIFPGKIVPIDADLSWKRRFLGDERFNAEEALPPTSPELDSLMQRAGNSMRGDAKGSAGFDASGVVQLVKGSEGKLKIKHGPIERHDMPAMTMMFRVNNNGMLDGLEKGTEIEFDVDNTSAGFVITRLQKKQARFDATGTVQLVRAGESKLKIEHGPIERHGMPPMTMMFRVADPGLLAGLEKGTQVAFDVDNTTAGFEITRLQTMTADAGGAFDARGQVRSLMPSQGKVKIEHGPIDKYGMPAMTMVFKLGDPEMLAALESNMQVDFDVDDAAGGFEITRIQPTAGSSRVASVGSSRCFRVGPFRERAVAAALGERYRQAGAQSDLKSTQSREYVGTLVYIDGLDSRDAAVATARELESKGFDDFRVLDEPGKRNALALGVFGRQQNAERIERKVTALNYPVKTEARYREQRLYWLHNKQPGANAIPELLNSNDSESGIRLVPGDCKAMEDA